MEGLDFGVLLSGNLPSYQFFSGFSSQALLSDSVWN
jgi:hypothetical protein